MFNRKRLLLYSILFISPAFLCVFIFFIVPILLSFYYSLFSWDILDVSKRFVGFDNFAMFLRTEGAMGALRNTIVYASAAAVFKNLAGLLLAIVLDSGLRSEKVLRTCILSTTMMSLIITGYIWTYLYHPKYGIGPFLERFLGLSFLNQEWLGNPNIVLYSILFVSVWQIAGKYMVIYLAGLQTVPTELYEAASIDGAGALKRFFKISLPMIVPAITIGLLNAVIQSLKVFDEIYAMTKGGPGFASETLTSLLFFQTFFFTGRAGFGSAISVILFALVLAVSLILLFFMRRKEMQVYGT